MTQIRRFFAVVSWNSLRYRTVALRDVFWVKERYTISTLQLYHSFLNLWYNFINFILYNIQFSVVYIIRFYHKIHVLIFWVYKWIWFTVNFYLVSKRVTSSRTLSTIRLRSCGITLETVEKLITLHKPIMLNEGNFRLWKARRKYIICGIDGDAWRLLSQGGLHLVWWWKIRPWRLNQKRGGLNLIRLPQILIQRT